MTKEDTIRLYYQKVDAQEIDWVMGIFADHARYQRADADYIGKSAISDFYRNHRKIRGKHTIAGILSDINCVVAYGEFKGVGAQDQAKQIEFCDVWRFDGSMVVYRHTYLGVGSDYVKS